MNIQPNLLCVHSRSTSCGMLSDLRVSHATASNSGASHSTTSSMPALSYSAVSSSAVPSSAAANPIFRSNAAVAETSIHKRSLKIFSPKSECLREPFMVATIFQKEAQCSHRVSVNTESTQVLDQRLPIMQLSAIDVETPIIHQDSKKAYQ